MSENLKRAIDELQQQLGVKLGEVSSLKQTVNMLSKQIGEPAPYPDVEPEAVKTGKPLRTDVFFGKSPLTAAREYLEYKNHPLSAQDILDGLLKGGFDAAAFGWKDEKMVLKNLAISLSKNSAMFQKLPNESFGLVKWYPELPKQKTPKPPKSPPNEKAEDQPSLPLESKEDEVS